MKPIQKMNDQDLIRYIEGQSLILSEFGMDSEFHIAEWTEPEFEYSSTECQRCNGFGEIADDRLSCPSPINDMDAWELFDYDGTRECPECEGCEEVETEKLVPVLYREVYETTNFVDGFYYEHF